jgi:hypothetical protein
VKPIAKTAFVYFCSLAVAIGSVTWSWSAFKRMLDGPTLWNYVEVILAPASLFVSTFFLAFFRYAIGKANGTITHQIPFFERLMKR